MNRLESRESIESSIEIYVPKAGLVLRQFTPNDAQDIFGLIDRNKGHLSQHDDDTAKKYPSLEDVLDSIRNPKNPNRLRFAIRDRTETLVGSINLEPEKANQKVGEIGYYMGSEFTRKGYMTEAVKSLSDYAFNNLGYELLYGDVHEDNLPSIRVLRKAGYVKASQSEETVRYIRTKDTMMLHIPGVGEGRVEPITPANLEETLESFRTGRKLKG